MADYDVSVVPGPRRLRRFVARLTRVLRWQPSSHPQVWSLTAGTGLMSAAAAMAGGRDPGAGVAVALAVVATLCAGGAGSYRLSRRRDAATVADWVASRPAQQPRQ